MLPTAICTGLPVNKSSTQSAKLLGARLSHDSLNFAISDGSSTDPFADATVFSCPFADVPQTKRRATHPIQHAILFTAGSSFCARPSDACYSLPLFLLRAFRPSTRATFLLNGRCI